MLSSFVILLTVPFASGGLLYDINSIHLIFLHYPFMILKILVHSVLKLFIGLASAAFNACKPTVNNAIVIAVSTARANIHH